MPPVEISEMVSPTQDESKLARESSHQLARLLGGLDIDSRGSQGESGAVKIEITLDGEHEVVALPASALKLLNHILTQMAEGNAVTLLPTTCEITTQQAADTLNVSRPFLIDLLEKNQIPFRKVGSHRRILLADVMNYKRDIDGKRMEVLKELAALTQEMELED